jgi:carbonic anhydrase
MELFTDEVIRSLLASSLSTSSYDGIAWKDTGNGPGSHHGEFVDWLTIVDQAKSVALDVERIRNHPLVPGRIPIYGFVYQVETGKLVEVRAATEIGRPRGIDG